MLMTEQAEAGRRLPRGLLMLFGGAAAVITVAGLRSVSDIVAPAFLALVLTIAAHPMRGWLKRRGLPGWLATVVMIVTVYSVLLGLALSLVVSIARLATLLPQYHDDLSRLVVNATDWLTALGVSERQIRSVAEAFDVGQLVELASGVVSGLAGAMSNLVFVVTLLLFLAFDSAWFPARLSVSDRDGGGVGQALAAFASGTRTYLVVSTIFGLIVAILDVGLLYLLAIPLPLLWGLLAFITNYSPNIGFVVGLIPPALLGLLEGGVGGALAVVLGYCLLNVVIQSVIQPKFVGDAVGLSPSLTFLSLVFWAWAFGPLGALLAIPLSLLTRALLVDADPQTRRLRALLSGSDEKPAPAPRVRLAVSPATGEDDPADSPQAGGVAHPRPGVNPDPGVTPEPRPGGAT